MAELSDAYQVARRQVQARCLGEACRSCINAVSIAIRNGVCTSRLVDKTTVEITGKHLQIDLLAEQELTVMLQMQRAICRKLNIDVEVADERLRRLLEETDIDKLAAHLDKRLPTT